MLCSALFAQRRGRRGGRGRHETKTLSRFGGSVDLQEGFGTAACLSIAWGIDTTSPPTLRVHGG
jgi:hypothetical protein